MRAGDLRHKIMIQSRGAAADANGQQIILWTNLADIHAKVEELGGYELMAANSIRASNTTRVTIRYRPDVTEKMRILYNGKILDITSTSDVDGRRRELELMCKDGVNQG